MVWLWSGYGLVMVWLWSGYGLVTIWLWSGYDLVVIWSLPALVCWLDEGPVSSDADDMVRLRSGFVKPPEI